MRKERKLVQRKKISTSLGSAMLVYGSNSHNDFPVSLTAWEFEGIVIAREMAVFGNVNWLRSVQGPAVHKRRIDFCIGKMSVERAA